MRRISLHPQTGDPIEQTAGNGEIGYAGELNRQLGMSKPFVVDTSRNGIGNSNGQWCNPPGQRLGLTPRDSGGGGMLLWLKVPGESDGSCNRGISGSTTDPEWGGIVDPAAGVWFPAQALQLAQLANPPLTP